MKIEFKSLLILSEFSTTCGDVKTTRTVYDLNSIWDHTLEMPEADMLLHSGVWGRVALFVLPSALLLLLWSDGNPLGSPLLFFGGLLPVFSLFYFLSYATVKNQELENWARRDRGLPAEARLSAVEKERWGYFLTRIKSAEAEPGTNLMQRSAVPPVSPELRQAIQRLRIQPRADQGGSEERFNEPR